jgi:hypothetical protein
LGRKVAEGFSISYHLGIIFEGGARKSPKPPSTSSAGAHRPILIQLLKAHVSN